jgi:hypothetical protein
MDYDDDAELTRPRCTNKKLHSTKRVSRAMQRSALTFMHLNHRRGMTRETHCMVEKIRVGVFFLIFGFSSQSAVVNVWVGVWMYHLFLCQRRRQVQDQSAEQDQTGDGVKVATKITSTRRDQISVLGQRRVDYFGRCFHWCHLHRRCGTSKSGCGNCRSKKRARKPP